MASYSVVRAKHFTLTGSQVDSVTFTSNGGYIAARSREATGGDTFYFSVDGTTPTVGGESTYVVPPGISVLVETASKTIQVISSGTPDISVELY